MWLAGAVFWILVFLSDESNNFWHPSSASDLLMITWNVFIVSMLGARFAASIFGRTVLELDDQNLYIRRYILWFASTHQIGLDVLQEPLLVAEERRGQHVTPSRLRFMSGAREFDCCSHIEGDEVYELVLHIRQAFPDLARRWGTGHHHYSLDVITLNIT